MPTFFKTLVVWTAAATLLAAMALLMLTSSREDALTFDEVAHIPAGYAYLALGDNRLNPEHPPLLKMLAAIPLAPLNLKFPLEHPAWQEEINGQWAVGGSFLYESGNDPHLIAARARLVPIALTVLLGLVLFMWARRFTGDGASLLALFFYTFSPTILAHGRFVTTDIAAAFGVAIASFAFIRFLKNPGVRTVLWLGLTLGIAFLLKFSTVLLVPLLGLLTLVWLFLEPRQIARYLASSVFAFIVAAGVVLLPYLWTTYNYPPERQLRDTYFTLFNNVGGPAGRAGIENAQEYFELLKQDRTRDLRACGALLTNYSNILKNVGINKLTRCPADVAIYLADKPVLRGWGQHLFGLIMITQRTAGGNTAYFLGEVSAKGWRHYFPTVYAIKETLPFHILTALALLLAFGRVWGSGWGIRSTISWLRGHPAETVMLGWIALYWATSIASPLNIGVRHLIPVFPFTMILVAREVSQWLGRTSVGFWSATLRQGAKAIIITLLAVWQLVGVLLVYPSFLAYFNEAVGGPENGARYVTDSNLDWGQDLRRLRQFVETRGINKIAVDYFGGGSPRYELGEKFVPWWSAKRPYDGWLAVSANTLIGAQARWDPALEHKKENSYEWLRGKEPVAKIGYSIWVYDLRKR